MTSPGIVLQTKQRVAVRGILVPGQMLPGSVGIPSFQQIVGAHHGSEVGLQRMQPSGQHVVFPAPHAMPPQLPVSDVSRSRLQNLRQTLTTALGLPPLQLDQVSTAFV